MARFDLWECMSWASVDKRLPTGSSWRGCIYSHWYRDTGALRRQWIGWKNINLAFTLLCGSTTQLFIMKTLVIWGRCEVDVVVIRMPEQPCHELPGRKVIAVWRWTMWYSKADGPGPTHSVQYSHLANIVPCYACRNILCPQSDRMYLQLIHPVMHINKLFIYIKCRWLVQRNHDIYTSVLTVLFQSFWSNVLDEWQALTCSFAWIW